MGRSVFELHSELINNNPEYREAYNALEQEFAIARALIDARASAGMTQADVANLMGVSQPVVARMESGRNVSVKSLRRYANAVGRSITILIQPDSPSAQSV